MVIVNVLGKTKSGKSSAIRYAIKELVKEGFAVEYNSKRYMNDSNTIMHKMDEAFPISKNYVGQITVVGKIKNTRICITTYGDSFKYDINPALSKGLSLLGTLDIFVCCSHGEGREALNQLSNTTIEDLKKNRSEEYSRERITSDNRKFGIEVSQKVLELCK